MYIILIYNNIFSQPLLFANGILFHGDVGLNWIHRSAQGDSVITGVRFTSFRYTAQHRPELST